MKRVSFSALLALRIAARLLSAPAEPEYRQAMPGYHYSFPRDHFNHPDFKTEWWYYTGNWKAASGERFGIELVFFRQAQRRGPSDNRSRWRADDLYLAHAALTDVYGKRFYNHKRLNRAGPGIAGMDGASRRIWNGNWSSQWSDAGSQTLTAITEDFRFTLQLTPEKPPVIHGIGGVSQKSPDAGKASHYVSFTRLRGSGRITLGARFYQVSGTAWMDHEWFSHQLEATQVGWDWFSIQLDNHTELMLFELRRKDGTIDPYSSGTFVDAQGRSRHLTAADFTLKPLAHWKKYPVRWRIEAPSLGISLECVAAFDAQELVSSDASAPTYWEGAVTYSGSHNGIGYLEMTGYDKAVSLQ